MSNNGAPWISCCLHARLGRWGCSRQRSGRRGALLFLVSSSIPPASSSQGARETQAGQGGRWETQPWAKLLSSGMAGVRCGALPPLSHLHGAGALTQKESEKENLASPPGFHGSWARPGGRRGGAWRREDVRTHRMDLVSPGAAEPHTSCTGN